MWNKSINKDTKIISLTNSLNDQRMKFEEFHKNYNKNRNNKIKPNENNPSSNPGGNNSKLRVPEWRVKFKGKKTTVDRRNGIGVNTTRKKGCLKECTCLTLTTMTSGIKIATNGMIIGSTSES